MRSAGRVRREQFHELNAPDARVLCFAGNDARSGNEAMRDAAAHGRKAVAGIGVCNRIIAARRCGSISIAGAINAAIANAITTANDGNSNAADTIAGA
jgi:hypothetical protein